MFAERGFEETTVDDIAEALGVSRRTLFRYFASKNDMVWGDFDWVLGRLQRCLDATGPGEPLHEALRRAVVESNRYEDEQLPELRIRMRLITGVPALQAHSTLRYAEWRAVIADFVAGAARMRARRTRSRRRWPTPRSERRWPRSWSGSTTRRATSWQNLDEAYRLLGSGLTALAESSRPPAGDATSDGSGAARASAPAPGSHARARTRPRSRRRAPIHRRGGALRSSADRAGGRRRASRRRSRAASSAASLRDEPAIARCAHRRDRERRPRPATRPPEVARLLDRRLDGGSGRPWRDARQPPGHRPGQPQRAQPGEPGKHRPPTTQPCGPAQRGRRGHEQRRHAIGMPPEQRRHRFVVGDPPPVPRHRVDPIVGGRPACRGS